MTNVSTLHYGVIPINISINDTFNNTNSTIIFVNITDTTAPTFSPTPSDQSVQVDNQFLYDVNATDNYNISSFTVNDTTLFKINISGTILNNTILVVGTYNLNISVNDTFNNTKSSAIIVTVTSAPPPAEEDGGSSSRPTPTPIPIRPTPTPVPIRPTPPPVDPRDVLTEREVQEILSDMRVDIRVPPTERVVTDPVKEGPIADRGEVQRRAISDVERVLVEIYNPGDKDLVVTPRLREDKFELKDEERVEDILRERLLDEFKDINEDELRQKIEERKKTVALIERENVDFISVGKTASFFRGEVEMYSGDHTSGRFLRNSLLTEEIVVKPKETLETELFLKRGISLNPEDIEIILESKGVLLEEKKIEPDDGSLIGTDIDFGEEDNIMDVYVLIPKEVSAVEGESKYHLEMDINQRAWEQKDLENIIVPKFVSSFAEFYGPYDVLPDEGAFLAQEIVYKFDPRSDYVIKSRIYKDGTLVSEHEFERLAIEKVAKDEFYDSPALVGRAFGTAVKFVPFGYRAYWMALAVLFLLIIITIYLGIRLYKIYCCKTIKRKGVFDDLEEAKIELTKKIKVAPTFKRGKIASLIIVKRRLIKAALLISFAITYPFVALYRGFKFVKDLIVRQFMKLFRHSTKMSAEVSDNYADAVRDNNRFVRKEVRRTEKKLFKFLLAIGLSLRAAKNWIKRQFRKLFRRTAKVSGKVSGGISQTSSAFVKSSKNAKKEVSETSSMVVKVSKRSLWKFIKNLVAGTLFASKYVYEFLTKWTIYTFKALVVGLAVIIKDTYLLIRKVTIWSGRYLFLLSKSVFVGIWIALTSIVRFILFLVSFTLRNIRNFIVWSRSMISIGSSNLKTYLWDHKPCPHVKIKGTGIPAIVVSPLKKKPIVEWKQRRKLRLMEEMEQVDLRLKDIDKVSFKKMLKKPVTVVSKKKKILFIEKLAIRTKTKPTIVEKPTVDVSLSKELKWIDRGLIDLDKGKVVRTARGIVKKPIVKEHVTESVADRKAVEEVIKISKELEERHQLARLNESKLQKELEKLDLKLYKLNQPIKRVEKKRKVLNVPRKFSVGNANVLVDRKAVQEVIKVSKEMEERHQLEKMRRSKLNKELKKIEKIISGLK